MKKEDIIDAYCKIRTIDQTIPDDVLDFMKNAAIEALEEDTSKKHVVTQKIYTYPDRELYGEYCQTALFALRLQILRGEIKRATMLLG
jgi:hypothetical protein